MISRHELGTYKSFWRTKPAAYPEILPFVSNGGRLALRGLGGREARRFRGRWNAERAVFRPATGRARAR